MTAEGQGGVGRRKEASPSPGSIQAPPWGRARAHTRTHTPKVCPRSMSTRSHLEEKFHRAWLIRIVRDHYHTHREHVKWILFTSFR